MNETGPFAGPILVNLDQVVRISPRIGGSLLTTVASKSENGFTVAETPEAIINLRRLT